MGAKIAILFFFKYKFHSESGIHCTHVWRHVTMVALFLDDNKTNDDGDGKENGKK